MKKYTTITLLILGLLLQTYYAQDKKLAQTGMKFLGVSTDARASSMSEAVTAVDLGSASAVFYNPSTMASLKEFTSFSVGRVGWIADINYIHSAIAFAPEEGRYGVLGFSFLYVDYGDFNGTVVASNDKGYVDVGTYSPKAYSFGVSYARELSTKFSVGGSVKYVNQDLGSSVVDFDATSASYITEENSKGAIAFDFGIFYRTGFKSLNFGMSVRNFSQELSYKKETFQMPLTFKIGLSMDALDLFSVDKNMHSLIVSIDASHPRDYSEQIFVGGEYTFMKTFSVRAGFVSPSDEYHFTAGVGVKRNIGGVDTGIDFAYQPFGIFDNVYRFTFNFAL